MYDLIQATLTATIQVVAIAGMTSIVAHAMWKHHCNWMATYCPPVKPFESATQVEASEPEAICLQQRNALAEVLDFSEDITTPIVEQPATADLWTTQPITAPIIEQPAIADPWGLPITTSSRRWVQPQPTKPQLALPPAKHQTPTFEGYASARLRKIAKAMKIKRYSVMQPQELMVAISKHPAAAKYLTA